MATTPELHVHIHVVPDELAQTVQQQGEMIVSVASDLVALQTTVTEFNEDIAAKVAALEAAQGEFTVEGQAAFDALKATVEAGVAMVGDADQDGNPPPLT